MRGRTLEAMSLIGCRVLPLVVAVRVLVWRSAALHDQGTNGMGFVDLMISCLLVSLLPALLANTRWVQLLSFEHTQRSLAAQFTLGL